MDKTSWKLGLPPLGPLFGFPAPQQLLSCAPLFCYEDTRRCQLDCRDETSIRLAIAPEAPPPRKRPTARLDGCVFVKARVPVGLVLRASPALLSFEASTVCSPCTNYGLLDVSILRLIALPNGVSNSRGGNSLSGYAILSCTALSCECHSLFGHATKSLLSSVRCTACFFGSRLRCV